jgi:anti-sigma regulatory factor (Ser/Thr protein kinase)
VRADAPLVLLAEDPRTATNVVSRALARHVVSTTVCVFDVRRSTRRAAFDVGFSRIAAEELTIVASELCSNIVKYGVRGVVTIEALSHPRHGEAIAMSAWDKGPPFRAFERATRDRSDDVGTIPPEAMFGRSGIGGGLAAVRRLSDGIFLDQRTGEKTIVVVRNLRASR